ncbi:MAG TPA: hypothetical protein VKD89_01105 [Candidatus Udaeobacter sp.]|nr:hypothetical protein [Candidatus Udaeobacter sp.]
MQAKTKKNKAKKAIKVQDLKPKKDAKGGRGHGHAYGLLRVQ